jgi:hypothetical protein
MSTLEGRLYATETACCVIADISGYTNFLAGVELDHAQDIIADVMNTSARSLVRPRHRTRPNEQTVRRV